MGHVTDIALPAKDTMKKIAVCTSSLILLCSFGHDAYASGAPLTLQECNAFSSEINKSVPMVIDRFTTLDSTFCTPGKRKPIMNYRASLGAPKAKLSNFESGLKEMKRQQLNSWCTDPEQLKALKKLDVLNLYYDSDRIFVGEILLKHADCAGLSAG